MVTTVDAYGPLTLEDLALSLAALSEGFALQTMAGTDHRRVERPEVDRGVGSDWTLFGCAVEAIVESFTAPLEPPGR